MEIWKSTQYQDIIVSNMGNVYNTKTQRLLALNAGTNDYKKVSVKLADGSRKTREVHRIILETFKPLANQKNLVVNHISGNKSDNRLCNLEWVTQRVNTSNTHFGKHQQKLTKEQQEEVRALYDNGMSLIKITKFMNNKYNRTTQRNTYTKIVRG